MGLLLDVAPEYDPGELQQALGLAIRDRSPDESVDALCLRTIDHLPSTPSSYASESRTTVWTSLAETFTTENRIGQRVLELAQAPDVTLCTLLKGKDQIAATAIVQRYHRFIGLKASQLLGRSKARATDAEDLKQLGLLEFLESARRWDPRKGANLLTFAGRNAVLTMLRYLYEYGHQVKLSKVTAQKLGHLETANTRRAGRGLRPLHDIEAGQELDMPVDAVGNSVTVAELRQARALTSHLGSLDSGFSSRELGGGTFRNDFFNEGRQPVTPVTSSREQITDPADLVMRGFRKDAVASVLSTLSPREAQVIRLRFGLDDDQPKTLKEVGEIIGINGERTKQIESKALSKLRHPSRSDQLRDFLG